MISGILLDLSGVLYTDNLPIQGATESLSRLQNSGLPIRYVTNTTRKPRHKIHQQLLDLGFTIDSDDLFTAPMAAHAYLTANGLSPFLLIHPDLMDEFTDLKGDKLDAVLIGDADQEFTYNNMNTAFRLLIEGAPLVAMGKNRYFMQQDGLSIDAGAFVTALEYAADTQAIITGKPELRRVIYDRAVRLLTDRQLRKQVVTAARERVAGDAVDAFRATRAARQHAVGP